MKRLAALALIAVSSLLGGCVTYDDYAYHDRDGYYDDRYDDGYRSARYYYDRYGNRVYYNDYDVSHRYGGAGYGRASWGSPDYFVYNSYYSVLWPTYRYYYDPFWSPGFYYGVTFFPRTYFGLNVGWHSWPYYQAYSPYRYSHADHYYDWWDYGRARAASRQRYYGNHYLPRYGSARNEAQYLARITGARGAAQTYYGASAQPGSIVDPLQARQLHSRGGTLPFERGTRDWSDTQPYGPDGRNYRGFIGQDTGAAPPRDASGRGVDTRGRASSYPDNSGTQTRTQRGYQREMPRNSGYVAPAPNTRSYDRASERSRIRDERELDTSDSTSVSEDRYYRGGRSTITPSTPQPQPQYESRSREAYRSRAVEQRQAYQPSAPVERSYSRSIERSQPVYQAAPRGEPSYERAQRSEPVFQRSEPSYERPQRSAPSQTRSEPRSAPSYDPPSRSDSSSSSASDDDGSRRSSRGQLERIVRDDD